MDNNDKSNSESSNDREITDDSFEFLDSLMADVMETVEDIDVHTENESQIESSATASKDNLDANSEQSDEHEDLDEVEHDEVIVERKQRAPLLQSIMGEASKKVVKDDSANTNNSDLNNNIDDNAVRGPELPKRKPVRSGGLLGRIGDSSKEVVEDKLELNDLDDKVSKESPVERDSERAFMSDEVISDDTSPPREPESKLAETSKDNLKDSEPFKFHRPLEKLDKDIRFEQGDKVAEDDVAPEEDVIRDVKDKEGSDELDNMFEDMFEDLTSSEVVDKEEEEESGLDKDVKVPLETKDMRSIKVTADGRTLADMLPGVRSGNKSVNDFVAGIRSSDKVVEVDGVKYSDNRYTKHIEEIEKERKEQDERRSLSKKFIQRNAEFTEQEKIIMENLGLTNKQFSKIMSSKEMTKKQKEELLGLGRYGAERHFKGRKYRTTVGDTAMLEFLVKFKFANTRILRWISNEPQNRTWRKLNRLRENGLVESRALIGVPDLWAATYAGVGVSGHSYEPGLRPMPKMTTVSSTMGINYIAACLWFNSVNVLNLDDFPQHNREIALQKDGRDRVQGEMLVSELEIRSSLGKEINPQSTTMQTLGDERLYDVIASNVRNEVDQWEQGGKVGPSPEKLLGNEYMWVLFPTSQLTLSYHVPDLVVQRERGPNGEPKSIAVEMERYEKGGSDYDKIMLAYKLDEHLYEKVIWITPNTRVARALQQAADNVGLENDRLGIIPIITESGTYNKQDIWMI